MTRFRRQMVATGAALGIAAAVVGTAAAADQVSYINVPSDFSQPLGITAGPDGNMWFADPGAQSIGKMPPGGSPLLIPAPGAGGPAGITSGPDGTLWYTEFGTDAWFRPHGDSRQGQQDDDRRHRDGHDPHRARLEPPGHRDRRRRQPLGRGQGHRHRSGGSRGRRRAVPTPPSARPVLNAQGVARGPAGDPNIYVTTAGRRAAARARARPRRRPRSPRWRNAFGIALGPDGNFWVTHPGGIEHIAPPAARALSGGVAAPGQRLPRRRGRARTARMWFAEYATDTVGVVTTGGQYRAIPRAELRRPRGRRGRPRATQRST